MNTDNGALEFDTYFNNTRLNTTALEAERRIRGLSDTAVSEGKKMESSFSGVGNALAAIGGTAFLGMIGKQIIETTGQFQQLNIAFETMLGSKEKADRLMQEAVDFAAKTPFTLTDVATNIKQLLAMGIASESVMDTIKSLGDVASGLSVPMSQLAVNYGQVATQGKLTGKELRDFNLAGVPILEELAKNLGKSKNEINELVSAGSIGFADVENAFRTMSSEGGKFFDLMEKQSTSVTGQISNLSDKFTVMLNDIGSANTGLISGGIGALSGLVENYKEVGDAILELVAIYGVYKATLMTLSAVQTVGVSISSTAEAQSLTSLLSVQQQGILAKKGLAASSIEYQVAVRSEITANMAALKVEAEMLAIKVNATEQEVISTRISYASKKQKIAVLREELAQEIANLNVKKAAKIQTQLDTAITERNILARDLRAKKILVETTQEQAQTAAKAVNTLQTNVNTSASVANVTVTNIMAAAKTKLIAIEKALSAAMAANPWTLAAIGVAALAAGIYYLATMTNDAEKAQNRLKKSVEESNVSIASERIQVDALFARLKAAKKGTEEYQAAKDAILSKYGGYLSKLGDEANALNNVSLAYKTISEEAAKAAKARALEASTKESSDILAQEQGDTKTKLKKLLDEKFGKDSKKSLEVFYQLTPLIDAGKGSEAINKEFAKKFDISRSVTSGSAVGGADFKYVQNDLKRIIDDGKKANDIFEKVNKQALLIFGEAPKKEDIGKKGEETAKIVINAKYWEEEVKSAKEAIDSLDTESKTYDKDWSVLQNRKSKAERELKKIRGEKAPKNTQAKDENTYEKDKLDNERKVLKESESLIKKGIEEKIKLYDDELKQTGISFEKEQELSKLRIEEKKKLIDIDLAQTMRGIDEEEKEFLAKAKKAGVKKPDLSSFKSLRDSATAKSDIEKEAVNVVDVQAERDKLSSLLSSFRDIKQKMFQLESEYDNDVKRLNNGLLTAKTEAEKEQITQSLAERKKQYDKDSASLGETVLKQSDVYKNLLVDLSEQGYKSIVEIDEKAKKIIASAIKSTSGGENFYTVTIDTVDSEGKPIRQSIKLSEQAFNEFKDNLNQNENELKKRNPFKALIDAIKKYKEDSSSLNFKDLMKNIGDSLEIFAFAFDKVNSSLDKLGINTTKQEKEVLEDISGMIKGASDIATGIATGNPLQIIQGSIDLISNGIDLIAGAKDRKLEKSIERHKSEVDKLKTSYEELERAIDKALGSSRYSSQKATIDNLKKQQSEYSAMAREEANKKKKDDSKISEYQKNIVDNANQIEDTISKMREDILGMDIKSVANDLGNAMIDAFSAGENAAEAWGKKVNDIVGDVIRKMLVQKLVEEPVGNIINKYMAKWVDKDGNFLGFDAVMNTATQMGNELSAIGPGLSAALEALPADIKKYITGDVSGANENKTALSGAIKSVSEDTAGVISGQLNAIRINQAQSITILQQQLLSLNQIVVNTENLNGILNAMNTLVNGGRSKGYW